MSDSQEHHERDGTVSDLGEEQKTEGQGQEVTHPALAECWQQSKGCALSLGLRMAHQLLLAQEPWGTIGSHLRLRVQGAGP